MQTKSQVCTFLAKDRMPEDQLFLKLLNRIREGDPHAAVELIRQYETQLRIIARVNLRSNSLRRAVDSMDICQSVLGGFFQRMFAGDFEFHTSSDVLNLLAKMIRNKVVDVARHEGASRRDRTRLVALPADNLCLAASTATPSEIVSTAELLEEFDRRLSPMERQLRNRRQAGVAWEEIAQELGTTVVAAQKQYSRAMARVANELGLDRS